MACTRGPACQAKRKKPWRRKRRRGPRRLGHRVSLPASAGRQPSRQISPRMEAVQRPGGYRSSSGTADPEGHSSYRDELGQPYPLCSRAFSDGCAERDGAGLPLPSGSARRVIRLPGRTADQDHADDCWRHPWEGALMHTGLASHDIRRPPPARQTAARSQRGCVAIPGHGESESSVAERDGGGDDADDDRAHHPGTPVEHDGAYRALTKKGNA